jgi:DNA polymerase-3 subunit gamma/tau
VVRSRASQPPSPKPDGPGDYTVVARRYRPQRFEDVVGQDHVVRALRNAIRLNRVTHAYLFSGTRGVGKTSVARIFAKCLNCVKGPTEEPCNVCDICQAISLGQDVDVIEIDGASNNGVEAVRELRQNAGLRPSRSRFKIYYIDEVHMLSTGAFNALLKTLEEPPGHVKFLFATTEPGKIPITVLSRCQRYDFAGITPDQIAESLKEICEREGVAADEDALRAIARRASGSMRDAQSLLEQLLSVDDRLTVDVVHQQLGIASDERTLDLLEALSNRDAAAVLALVDQAVASGVQPPELLGGALDFLRDAMVLAAGANAAMLAATPRQRPKIQAIVDRWPLDTILAAMQILADYRMKLRGSPHGRLLVETALVRVARLESMTELSEVIARLASMESDGPPAPALEKKKPVAAESILAAAIRDEPPPAPTAPEPVAAGPDGRVPWEIEAIAAGWPQWAEGLESDLATKLTRMAPAAILGPNQLAVGVDRAYNWVADACEAPETRARIELKLSQWLQRTVSIHFDRPASPESGPPPRNTPSSARDEAVRDDPMVKQVVELFDARPVRVEVDDGEPS